VSGRKNRIFLFAFFECLWCLEYVCTRILYGPGHCRLTVSIMVLTRNVSKTSNAFLSKPCFLNWLPWYLKNYWADQAESLHTSSAHTWLSSLPELHLYIFFLQVMAQIWPKKSLKFETSFLKCPPFWKFSILSLESGTCDSHKHTF